MKFLKCVCIGFLIFLFSCSKEEDAVSNENEINNSGVVLTFDDDYVEDWKRADDKLKEYSWKATFCVCRIGLMNQDRIQTLQEFQKYGHEIAGHGANHVNSLQYIAANGFDKFCEDEINPMMDKMNENGLKVTSFAYPYGVRNSATDEKLFNLFKVLRGTTYDDSIPEKQNCYYNDSNLVFGLGIDNNYAHFSMPYIFQLLDYANSHHKILILYSHKPVEAVTDNYQTQMENLISICKYVKQKHMRFYTLSDLAKSRT